MAENCISCTCVRLLGRLRVLLFSGPTAAGIAQRVRYHFRVYLLSFERLFQERKQFAWTSDI